MVGSVLWTALFIGGTITKLYSEEEDTSIRNEHSLGRGPQVTFENVRPETEDFGRKVISTTAMYFEEITGKAVGRVPVQVRFVDQLGDGYASRNVSGQMQAITTYVSDMCTIQISNQRSSSLGRILAHEVTHVFVREAFGRTSNQTLNEGLAEYIAWLEYPSEVQRNMRAANEGFVSPTLRPYVDGYRFCSHFSKEEQFASFLESEFQKGDASYDQLEEDWKESFPSGN